MQTSSILNHSKIIWAKVSLSSFSVWRLSHFILLLPRFLQARVSKFCRTRAATLLNMLINFPNAICVYCHLIVYYLSSVCVCMCVGALFAQHSARRWRILSYSRASVNGWSIWSCYVDDYFLLILLLRFATVRTVHCCCCCCRTRDCFWGLSTRIPLRMRRCCVERVSFHQMVNSVLHCA